jgi:hypothetical protein
MAHQNGLEAKLLLRGKPEGPTRPGCVFLVTSFAQAKEVTRRSGETKNFQSQKKYQ